MKTEMCEKGLNEGEQPLLSIIIKVVRSVWSLTGVCVFYDGFVFGVGFVLLPVLNKTIYLLTVSRT